MSAESRRITEFDGTAKAPTLQSLLCVVRQAWGSHGTTPVPGTAPSSDGSSGPRHHLFIAQLTGAWPLPKRFRSLKMSSREPSVLIPPFPTAVQDLP